MQHPLGTQIESLRSEPVTEARFTGPRHPVEQIQLNRAKRDELQKMELIAVTQGQAVARQMIFERELLAGCQRLPGHGRSSLVGLRTLLGDFEEISFEDYLNKDGLNFLAKMPEDDGRRVLESKLGLN